MAEEQEVVSSPRRLPVVDSDSEVTKALVCNITDLYIKCHKNIRRIPTVLTICVLGSL